MGGAQSLDRTSGQQGHTAHPQATVQDKDKAQWDTLAAARRKTIGTKVTNRTGFYYEITLPVHKEVLSAKYIS